MTIAYQINLSEMPKIFQIGLNKHGIVKEETFKMKNLWSLHLYRWKGQLVVDGEKFNIQPGSISLCPPGRPLHWKYQSKNAMHYYVHFYLGKAADHFIQFPAIGEYNELLPLYSKVLEQIIKDFKSNPLKSNVKFWDFLWDLSAHNNNLKKTNVRLPFALQTVTSIIHNELETSLPIKSLANRIGISQAHLLRLFKNHFKMTISEYIRKYRIDKSVELLQQTSLPIKAIATEVGIMSLQQFNKLFKKYKKLPPTKFRKKIK